VIVSRRCFVLCSPSRPKLVAHLLVYVLARQARGHLGRILLTSLSVSGWLDLVSGRVDDCLQCLVNKVIVTVTVCRASYREFVEVFYDDKLDGTHSDRFRWFWALYRVKCRTQPRASELVDPLHCVKV
jgi:hypothetical protein